MKNGVLALAMFILVFLVFAGCQTEVTTRIKCTKVVGIKTYVESFLGMEDSPEDYYVLEDGRLLSRSIHWYRVENTIEGPIERKNWKYCELISVPK